jgi:membrane protein implicated in regulation of membrane protease activity
MDLDDVWIGVKKTFNAGSKATTYIMTAGGSASLEKSAVAYKEKLDQHAVTERTFRAAESELKIESDFLGKEAEICIKLLRDAKDLVERLSSSSIKSVVPSLPSLPSPNICSVQEAIASFNAAKSAGQGAGLGIATSTGVWVLVAHLGTASTGAAISGLTGIAAQNAILAWFGGGAIAAGGGGMALGAFALGGLVALPLVAFSAFKSYKESSRIDKERVKVEDATATNIRNSNEIHRLMLEAIRLRIQISKSRAEFILDYKSFREEAHKLAGKLAARANAFASELTATGPVRGLSE